MNKPFTYFLIYFKIIFLIFFFTSCTSTEKSIDQKLLIAKVGPRAITLNEFIQRSEYTLRPPYCSQDNYIHKKIILNSLIGEKLLALEAGEKNELTDNLDFQAYIAGRKEQAMRKVLYYNEAYKQVKLNPDEIENEIKISGRSYRISYFTVHNKVLSEDIANKLVQKKINFEKIYLSLAGDTSIPSREVKWEDPENKSIYNALFKSLPGKGEIIGPVNIEDEQFIFIRIDGWIDRKLISENDLIERRNQVIEKLTNEKAWQNYKNFASKIMRNKTLHFYPHTFKKLVNIAGPIYNQSKDEKNTILNNSFWNSSQKAETFSDFPASLNAINHLSLFSIDGKLWTVERFRAYLKRHPLVFRKEGTKNKNFAEQFKLAIVDLVRDYYITQDAYEKGYENSEIVQRQVELWSDHMLALYQKYKILETAGLKEKNQYKIVDKFFTVYIDSLQKKYQNKIEINIENFEKAELTGIDMIALQPDQPFPVVVPSFPLITMDDRIDYGSVMK